MIFAAGGMLTLVQATCTASRERQFRVEATGVSAVRIRPRSARMGSDSCVSATDNETTTRIYLLACDDASAVQAFTLEHTRTVPATGRVMYRLRTVTSPTRCLGAYADSGNDGAAIVKEPCTGTSNQEFIFERPDRDPPG